MEEPTKTRIGTLFDCYERYFNQALRDEADMGDIVSLYATEVIGAAPTGVRATKNDAEFRQYLAQGCARYRATGMKEIKRRDIRLSPIDDRHCVAHVAWTATYSREDKPDVAIEFDVHYLVQTLNGGPQVFGWVSGDEQKLLQQHGIVPTAREEHP